MNVYPPNLYVKILIPEGDSIKRWSHEVISSQRQVSALVNEINAFVKKFQRESCSVSPFENKMRSL